MKRYKYESDLRLIKIKQQSEQQQINKRNNNNNNDDDDYNKINKNT